MLGVYLELQIKSCARVVQDQTSQDHVIPKLLEEQAVLKTHSYYRPQTNLRKGNVFYTCLSVILFTGGCLPQCMLGYTPRQTPPAQCMLG